MQNQQNYGKLPPYSVLMPIYCKERPEYFQTAIDSMLAQSAAPDELVIVCDGPLTAELDALLERCSTALDDRLNIVRLPENHGIGYALNEGLRHCRCELVARMDSDDISEPFRCERELEVFTADPAVDMVGGYILEFTDDPAEGFLRELPLEHADIMKMARRRNPFNHVTMMYKRESLLACGGYPELPRGEDYELFCRMLAGGARAVNLPELLVRVRVDENAYERRRNKEHALCLIKVRRRLYKMGICSLWDFLIMSCAHLVLLITPSFVTRFIYERKLRRKSNEN